MKIERERWTGRQIYKKRKRKKEIRKTKKLK
jgi:hypothetical protein